MMVHSEGREHMEFAQLEYSIKTAYKCLTFVVQFAGPDMQFCLVTIQGKTNDNEMENAKEIDHLCPERWPHKEPETDENDNSPAHSWADDETKCK